MGRHDSRRSGAADGKGNIQVPVLGWKSYLGGRLAVAGLLAADVEGNGKNALIVAAGGSVSAVRPDGTVIWSTPTSGAASLLGLADLDGDGRKEVVAYTSLRAMVLDLASGTIAWAQPAGEMGVLGDVRMADMNGDGLPELAVEEARGANGYKTQTGFIYSFPSGFGSPVRVVLPYPDTGGGQQSCTVDMNGKPGNQLLILGLDVSSNQSDLLSLVDATGTVIASSQPFGESPYGCIPAGDLDGSPGDEVVCFIASTGMPGPSDHSEVFALTLKSGSLQKLWSITLAPQNQAITSAVDDLVVDLAGDGRTETLIAGYDGTAYTVHVLDAMNLGHELAQIPGQDLVGTAPGLKGGARVILTTAANGISLWSFTQGAVQSLGTIGDDGVGVAMDWARAAVARTGNPRPFSIDVNGDGLPDIVTGNSGTGEIHVYTPGTTPPLLVGTISPAVGVPFNGIWPMPAMDRPYPQLALTATDGHLRLLDQGLSFTSADIKVGGFYYSGGYGSLGTSPVVASLDSPAQQILAVDSRGMLVRLDASAVTAGGSPLKAWEQPSSTSPVVAPGLDGAAAGIFSLHVVDPTASPPAYTLRRLHADGSLAWEVPVGGLARQDVVLAHFEGGGAVDVALQSSAGSTGALTTYAISGADGHTLWTASNMGCPSPDAVSIVDWNGDGVDDLVFQGGATYILSGVDGTTLAQGGPGDCYALPIPVDPDSSGTDDLVYTATFSPAQEYAHDLSTPIFQAMDQDQPFPYGAIAECPSGLVLVEGSASVSARLKLTALGSASNGAATSVFLVNGALYHDQASANAAGSGQLTAVNVHKDLTGAGSPSAVVGSSDGWLYAVDPCQGTLTFAYDLGAPVGDPVFGDTDGDGFDEILVEVGDGYLYDLRGTPLVQGTGGSGTGGAGTGGSGTGGAGTGGSGTGGAGAWERIYGRATCFCTAAPAAPLAPAGIAFAVGLAAAFARRSRRRAAPRRRP